MRVWIRALFGRVGQLRRTADAHHASHPRHTEFVERELELRAHVVRTHKLQPLQAATA